jgi:hypothetical protein
VANEILVFDALASNFDGTNPGSPLMIGPGTPYGQVAGDYPAAPQNVLYSSSIDTEGELPATAHYGNRAITLKLKMVDTAGTLLAALQAKFAKLQQEGGTLKRTMKNGDVRIYDIVAGDGWSPVYDFDYYIANVTVVEMVLPAKPYSRGAEVDLGDNVTTTLPWLVFTQATVAGDVPALGRLVIDNDEGSSMRWVGWAIRQKYYSAASTAALFYEAESCALFGGTTAVAGPAGASGAGSNVARNTNLTTIAGGLVYLGASATAQTHVGSFRVFARVYAPNTNTGTVSVGIQWAPQPQGTTIINPTVALSTAGTPVEQQWVVVDLGMINLPKVRKGTQGWIGYLTGQSTVGTDDLDVDWVALLPVDENYGEAYALPASTFGVVGSAGGTSVEVRHDGVIANDSTGGGYWIEPDVFEGVHLLVPPSGAEARTLQVICRFSRHIPLSVDRSLPSVLADVIGDVSAKLFVTPRYLT